MALLLALCTLAFAPVRAADLAALMADRVKSVVAVEYKVETESERHPVVAYGSVIDSQGTIILPGGAIDARLSPDELKDFEVYLPGDPKAYAVTYLGQDAFTGWQFLRVEERLRGRLTPITAFASRDRNPEPNLASEVWGIGLRPKDEDFAPYLMQSHLALVQSLPQRTGISQQEVAGPGLPVFDSGGTLVGLALNSFGESYTLFSQGNRGGAPVILVDVEESSAFTFADEVLPYLGRVPKNVSGRPLAWLGAYGLEPMDRDVAEYLKLSDQSGAVVSEVLQDSPAEKAGMKDLDLILAIGGRPLPHIRPDRYVVDYVDREVERRKPGDVMALTVLRGTDRIELKAVLGEEPKLVREAQRKYFGRLGFSVREFVYGDAVARRMKVAESTGVIVRFVKANSPAAATDLEADDWIKEIDGIPVQSFSDAVARLSAAEGDPLRSELVLLAARGGDTAVLRIKLR